MISPTAAPYDLDMESLHGDLPSRTSYVECFFDAAYALLPSPLPNIDYENPTDGLWVSMPTTPVEASAATMINVEASALAAAPVAAKIKATSRTSPRDLRSSRSNIKAFIKDITGSRAQASTATKAHIKKNKRSWCASKARPKPYRICRRGRFYRRIVRWVHASTTI